MTERDEFGRLKDDDAWHGINTTYWKDYEDGYAKAECHHEKNNKYHARQFRTTQPDAESDW